MSNPVYIDAGADIRDRYRYALWRTWDESLPRVMFVGLNPSTADARQDDPTLVRCVNFARDWGYGGVITTNLFAFRATDPRAMLRARDPVGPENDRVLCEQARTVDRVIAAWGNLGSYRDRAAAVRKLLPGLYYLKLNRSGEPAHPLYLKSDLSPQPYI